jgi:catechol 2,3-dioxygenase-like lactoylglutathione lyase family enzyme
MNANRSWWIAICGLLALGGQATAQGLGDGRGIDHVGLLVRLENFDAVTNIFTHQLGFSATPALLSPAGATNHLIWFRDRSYLEIDAFTELNDGTAPFLDFLQHHEGAKFYGTDVHDAAATSAFLTGAGYPNVGPIPAGPLTIESTGQMVGLTPLWNLVILTSRVAPDNSNFFLAYDDAQIHQMFVDFPVLAPRPHPNTAQKIDTLWLVVSDLDGAIDFYEGLGLEVHSKHKRIGYLGARSAKVRYNSSTLTLLEPEGPGLAASFAADRGEGIMGVSLKVGNLNTARNLVNRNAHLHLQTYTYQGRERFLIPASVTHGLAIEMVE